MTNRIDRHLSRPKDRWPATGIGMLVSMMSVVMVINALDVIRGVPISYANIAFQLFTLTMLYRIHVTQWGGTALERENDAKEDS